MSEIKYCKCGHAMTDHIYHEGACRPGSSKCDCFAFVPKSTISMSEELKECPVGHNTVEIVERRGDYGYSFLVVYQVRCKCGFSGPERYSSNINDDTVREEVASLWNARHPLEGKK